MDRGARGQAGEAGRVRGGLLHLQALAQGKEGQVVRQEPGEDVSHIFFKSNKDRGTRKLMRKSSRYAKVVTRKWSYAAADFSLFLRRRKRDSAKGKNLILSSYP